MNSVVCVCFFSSVTVEVLYAALGCEVTSELVTEWIPMC